MEDKFCFYINIKKEYRPNVLYDAYWRFAAERQNIFFRRNILHKKSPWTEDTILQKYKFTNAYRVNDRVSQFLISHVIYNDNVALHDANDIIFRILLFKIFNKIDTWQILENRIGDIRIYKNIFSEINSVLNDLLSQENTIYSGAYIMPSGKSSFGFSRKYKNHIALLKLMFKDKFAEKVLRCKTMEQLYNLLLSYPMIGSFLAYQYATDINYSEVTDFSEMEFVVPGPGAKSGIQKCFANIDLKAYTDIIGVMAENQEREFERLGLKFHFLPGHPLQLIDCQNLFCEFDKYARAAYPNVHSASGRKRIKQHFQYTKKTIKFMYPPKWNIPKL